MKLAFIFPPMIVDGRAVDFPNVWTSSRGTTGSELVVLAFSREMAKLGHEVALYIAQPNVRAWSGVKIRPLHDVVTDSEDVDAVLSLVDVNILRKVSPRPLRLCFQQLNNFCYGEDGFEEFVDLFVAPSHANAKLFARDYPKTAGRWGVIPNGCYPDEYDAVAKTPGLCAYTSSPDRGLHVALQEWPRIRKAVPGAELRVYYFALQRFLAEWRGRAEDPTMMSRDVRELVRRGHYIDHAITRLAGHGVRVMGATSRRQLAADLSRTEVLAFPCDTVNWTESFSCATLEGCASGALPVISDTDALGEIYGGSVPMVHKPAIEHAAEWRDLVIRALTDKPWADEWRQKARKLAEAHAWPTLAAKLEKTIVEAIAAKAPRPQAKRARPKIAIDLILSRDAASGQTINPKDLAEGWVGGGSRTGCIGLAKQLAKRGDYDVRLHSTFTRVADMAGIRCVPLSHSWQPRDVVMAYYDTRPLSGMGRGALRIASHHTYLPPALWGSGWAFDWMDVNTAPSAHAAKWLKATYDPLGRWEVLPNGVEDEGVVRNPVPGRVIYHTTADRGLHNLLRAWPEIRAQVPNATLHVVGRALDHVAHSFDGVPSGSVREKHARLLVDAIPIAEAAGGVTFTGGLSRECVLQELAEASCFAFPADVQGACETFSVSIMECLLVGIPVVLSPVDALDEMYGYNTDSGVIMIGRDGYGRPRMHDFTQAVVDVLQGADYMSLQRRSAKSRRYAQRFSFEAEAEVLHQIIMGPVAPVEKTNGHHARRDLIAQDYLQS